MTKFFARAWLIDNVNQWWRMASVQFAVVMGSWNLLDPDSQQRAITAALDLLGVPADRQIAAVVLIFTLLRLWKQPAIGGQAKPEAGQ